ncbi:MAG: CAP domain-containing protein [Chloroflexota bacterium]
MVELVNQERAKQGCLALRMDDTLHRAAYGHGADMLARDFVAHTNLDGKTSGQRLIDLGYAWWSCGENIAAASPALKQS